MILAFVYLFVCVLTTAPLSVLGQNKRGDFLTMELEEIRGNLGEL